MLRDAMPQPAVREGSGSATLIEGWLLKGSFNSLGCPTYDSAYPSQSTLNSFRHSRSASSGNDASALSSAAVPAHTSRTRFRELQGVLSVRRGPGIL